VKLISRFAMDIICFCDKHLGDRLGTTKQCEGRERKSQASFNIILEASSSIQPVVCHSARVTLLRQK